MGASLVSPEFHPWTSWANRERNSDTSKPGVYLLARFEGAPPSQVDPVCASIVYVGETCDQSLADRWYQFSRSAFLRKSGHSGGWTFSDVFCGNCAAPPPEWLYVSYVTVEPEEPKSSAYIRYLERMFIYLYADAFGKLPACNSK